MFLFFILASFFLSFIPLSLEQLSWLQTFSQLAKELILFFCPFLIFFNLTTSLAQFQKKAFLFILLIFSFTIITNGISVLLPFFLYKKNLIFEFFTPTQSPPVFLSLKKILILSPSWTFLISLFLGIFFAYRKQYPLFLDQGKKIINLFFQKIIPFLVPFLLLPLFSNLKNFSFQSFSKGLFFLFFLLFLQQSFLILLTSWQKKIFPWFLLKDFYQPFTFAFTSSSSLATLPLAIESCKKHSLFPEKIQAILTSFINIQQVADCLLNSFFVLFVHESFFHSLPDFSTWLIFTLHFTLMRFATTGVSGGAIFLMMPLYEQYFNFNQEMLNLILTFNILFDPVVTSFNILGNMNLTLYFEFLLKKLFSRNNFLFYCLTSLSVLSL